MISHHRIIMVWKKESEIFIYVQYATWIPKRFFFSLYISIGGIHCILYSELVIYLVHIVALMACCVIVVWWIKMVFDYTFLVLTFLLKHIGHAIHQTKILCKQRHQHNVHFIFIWESGEYGTCHMCVVLLCYVRLICTTLKKQKINYTLCILDHNNWFV